MSKIKKINLNDWEKVGGGGNADSYFNKKNDKIMLKLAHDADRNIKAMDDEIKIAVLVNKLKINTPKMICAVECDGRKGIIYERLKGKKSVSQLCSENPDKIEYYAKIYAKEIYKLHSKKCNLKGIPSIKKDLLDKFTRVKNVDKVVNDLIKLIKNDVKDEKYCVHGDISMGNLVLSQKKWYFIDTGGFTYGDPIADLSKTYFAYKVLSKFRFVQKIFHLNHEQLCLFCDVMYKEYARLKKVNYDIFIERVEKDTVIFAHAIWVVSTVPKILRDIARYMAKNYQKKIELKYKK